MGRGEKVHFGGTSKYYPICTKICMDMSEMQWNTGNMQPETFHNNYIYHGEVDHPNGPQVREPANGEAHGPGRGMPMEWHLHLGSK